MSVAAGRPDDPRSSRRELVAPIAPTARAAHEKDDADAANVANAANAAETTPTPPPVETPVDTDAPHARRATTRLQQFLAPFRSKPVQALGWFLLIAAIPYASPKLKKLRLIRAPWDHDDVVTPDGPTGITPEYGDVVLEQSDDQPPPTDEQHAPIEVEVAPAASAPDPKIPLIDVAKEVGANYQSIEDATGHSLDAFYAALAKTESGAPNSAVRVAHYGDSLIVSDFMSSTLRRRFQSRFGDAGHGFILTAKAWKWYLHYDVQLSSSEGWIVNRIVNPRIADELYGYGGVSFRSSDMGVKATFSTSKPIPGIPDEGFGRRVSKLQVHWLAQPGGGKLDVSVDGTKLQTIDTKATDKKLETTWVTTDDGEHTFEIKHAGGGEVRVFGVAMERDVPGVVWDALGVLGGRARMLDVNDTKHWGDSMRARDPALMIFQYGTNESTDTGYPVDQYESSLEQVLRHAKEAVPNAACLVVGPMDRGGKGANGETMPIIKQLEDSQRKIALKVGCAFWDTFKAMGADGAMSRWVKAKPQLGSGDYTHPTYAGASILGDLLYSALMSGYVSSPAYAKVHAQ
jgi:lysophospholipase L1-like esterase